MERAKRILGIEGGGTKTEWALVEQSAMVDFGRAPAANLRLSSDTALAEIFHTFPTEVASVGLFLAGCVTSEDRLRLEKIARAIWPRAALVVGSDRESGLAAAFQDADGISVIAGTGAAVHGRKAGRVEKAGGWGQLLGDRGGGYDLARRGLRLVLTDFDLHQRVSPLAAEILRVLELERLEDLVGWASRADKMAVARLAPAIFSGARLAPEVLTLVQAGASALAEFTLAVARRLAETAPTVKLLGGVFTHQEDYVALFKYRLGVLLPAAKVEVCRESGALGAAWLAEKITDPVSRISASAATTPTLETTPPKNPAAELAAASTEQDHPASAHLEKLSAEELVDLFTREEWHVARALESVRRELADAIDLVSTELAKGGRLFYVGAGTSGRLGVLDASEMPPTFGVSAELVQGVIAGGEKALRKAVEGAEDDALAGAAAIRERSVKTHDIVCGLTASGRTPFVLGALTQARALGARTLLLTCNPTRQKSAPPWDLEIDLPTGPELVAGSTRLKAGSATKAALNLLSTAVMIRLGHVRGGRMIDVKISNEKLRERGVRWVAEALEISFEEARTTLEAEDWNLRACLEKPRT